MDNCQKCGGIPLGDEFAGIPGQCQCSPATREGKGCYLIERKHRTLRDKWRAVGVFVAGSPWRDGRPVDNETMREEVKGYELKWPRFEARARCPNGEILSDTATGRHPAQLIKTMTKEEAEIAEIILAEIKNADKTQRSELLDQYDRLVRASLTRRAAEGKLPQD